MTLSQKIKEKNKVKKSVINRNKPYLDNQNNFCTNLKFVFFAFLACRTLHRPFHQTTKERTTIRLCNLLKGYYR